MVTWKTIRWWILGTFALFDVIRVYLATGKFWPITLVGWVVIVIVIASGERRKFN